MRIHSPNGESISISSLSYIMLPKIAGLQHNLARTYLSSSRPYAFGVGLMTCGEESLCRANRPEEGCGSRHSYNEQGHTGIRPQSRNLAAHTDIREKPVTE
jgi:hypothetical protein